MTTASERLTWTVDEVAAMLGVGETTVREQIKAGVIPARRLGNRIVIPKGPFQRWLDSDHAEATA